MTLLAHKFPNVATATHLDNGPALDYKDVFLVPQYSEITSRTQVDTSISLWGTRVDVPVISANMDTVTDGNMARAIAQAGGLGAIHRFMTVEDNVLAFKAVGSVLPCFVSVGVNEESKTRARALYAAGARWFIIDIAHGHSKMMKDMLTWMRQTFADIRVVAGNVATRRGTTDLFAWGADGVKVGIGPGAVCVTKNVTGVTVPQLSAVLECHDAASNLAQPTIVIADGGITEIGDIAKALGAGADLVMSGRLFASCKEAPGPRVNGKKVYRGMASKDAMLTIKSENQLPTPEGISTLVEASDEPVEDVVKHIKGGLQSSMSYSNATNLADFQDQCAFGLKYTTK